MKIRFQIGDFHKMSSQANHIPYQRDKIKHILTEAKVMSKG